MPEQRKSANTSTYSNPEDKERMEVLMTSIQLFCDRISETVPGSKDSFDRLFKRMYNVGMIRQSEIDEFWRLRGQEEKAKSK